MLSVKLVGVLFIISIADVLVAVCIIIIIFRLILLLLLEFLALLQRFVHLILSPLEKLFLGNPQLGLVILQVYKWLRISAIYQTDVRVVARVQKLNRRVVGVNDFRMEDVNIFRLDVLVLLYDVRYVNFEVDAKSKKKDKELKTIITAQHSVDLFTERAIMAE